MGQVIFKIWYDEVLHSRFSINYCLKPKQLKIRGEAYYIISLMDICFRSGDHQYYLMVLFLINSSDLQFQGGCEDLLQIMESRLWCLYGQLCHTYQSTMSQKAFLGVFSVPIHGLLGHTRIGQLSRSFVLSKHLIWNFLLLLAIQKEWSI